ncbi:thioester reductase domain-containing protein [Kitasatospora indigofera]|uniref:thioester reductase domain-containing protein n=1 Tax=Kitasatospora indigofera TaxID=67307 RepID=UPI0036C70A0D
MSSTRQLANDPLSSSWAAGFRSTLRAYARTHLPEAMVPAHFVVLPELPKLPNGKVDRGSLPALTGDEGGADNAYVAPRTSVEAQLARIWQDLLGLSTVGVETSFFDLGGDSLTVLQMAAQVREVYDVRLDLRRMFEDPTVAQLARMVSSQADPAVTGAGNPRGVGTEEMRADAVLPADIVPDEDALPAATGPYRNVLLTGGTGYTGAFLLRELLDRSQADVWVLVRADGPEQAARRVLENLAEYGLVRDGDRERVIGVPGDTGRPYLGLSREDHHRVAAEVEMIIHNAAISSWIVPYAKIKPVNILGAQEVLRLACRSRIKPVHFISTTGVYPGHLGERRWEEEPLTESDGVVGGYRQSKWVADSLMTAARERGIPTQVYRPGAITGSQVTGACATETFINHLIKGCIQLGAYLDYDLLLDLVPVDYCAASVVHLALGGVHAEPVFNLPSSRPAGMNELFELIVDFGYPLRRLDYRDWYQELSAALERGEENEMRYYLPLFGADRPAEEVGFAGAKPEFAAEKLHEALAGSGIECRPVDRDLFHLYLQYFVSTGYLPAPSTALDQTRSQ